MAHGVYRVRGGAEPDHLDLRAAWLQLDPTRSAWQRLDDPDGAIVSHASAAAMFGVGDLRADVHEFILPHRRQTRRPDVRLHRGMVPPSGRILLAGLPTARPSMMISQLLADHVDPDAVAEITTEVVDRDLEYPRDIADALVPYAHRFGHRRGDGVALLDEFLQRAGSRDREALLAAARRA